MKPKLSLAAILSTTAIATGVLLGSVSPATSCTPLKFTDQEAYEPPNWLHTPFAALITLPGIAIAAALSLGNRYYNG
jgi:hypothetical protein